jgi:protein gp37
MNKTKIDWADMTWNPVTGCLHGCEYCYARKIAQRFGRETPDTGCYLYPVADKDMTPYPWGFAPTLHTYRLTEQQKIKKPQNIFVCSMADLFGDWVPDEWIQKVFDACQNAPWHRYLFLTKNPKRYNEIRTNRTRGISISRDLRNRVWLGATATTQEQLYFAASALEDADQTVFTFLSIEPIFEPVSVYEIDCFANWVIIGAETGNRKNKPVVCKWWIDDIVKQCKDMNVPIFMKESLRSLMGAGFKQEFPWGGVKT